MGISENYFLFTIPAIETDLHNPTFRVVDFSGHEALSRPYVFRIQLVSEKEDLSGVLFKEASLTIRLGGQESVYRGIVSRFDQLQRIGDNCFYRAELMPKWHLLSLYRMSDVYLNQSLPDIIKTVFTFAGFNSNQYRLALKGAYGPPADSGYNRWSYVCQYEETCFDFLSRLMEREGFCYYFEQGASGDIMVITDDKIAHKRSTHELFYKAKGEPSWKPDDTAVQAFICQQKLLPKKVILKNYNYERASQSVMKAEAFVSGDGREDGNLIGEVNIFGENFSSTEEGETLAKIRAEELLCTGETFTGTSTAVPLVTGTLNHLTHPNERFSGWYLATEVRHEGRQSLFGVDGLSRERDARPSFYENSFTFIRDGVQFRPRQAVSKPKVQGTMTAFIDGETSGEFAQLDSLGRYKVKLPFALTAKADGKASTWIRMATPFAGDGLKGYGMHLPLHKGAEVLLAFRDGDPDQPVITGAVYNSQTANMVKDANLTQHVIKTPGGNQIIMDDTPGKEYMYLFSPFGSKGNWIYLGHGSGAQEGAFKGEKGDKGDQGAKGEKGESGSEESVMHVKSSGNKHELVLGQEDSFVIGSENDVTIGSKAEFMLGTASEFTLAMKSIFELAGTIEWKGGHHVDFGKTTDTIKDEAELLGTDKIKISGGLPIAEKAVLSTLTKALTFGGAAMGALLAAAGGDIGGFINPEAGSGVSEAVGQTVGTAVPILVGTGLQCAALAYLVKKLNTELTHAISNIELDDNGIKIKTGFKRSDGVRNTDGIYVGVGGMGDPNSSCIHIAPFVDPASSSTGVTICNNAANGLGFRVEMMEGQSVVIQHPSVESGKLTIDTNQAVLEKEGSGGKLTLDANQAAMEKGGGGGKVVAAADDITIQKGNNSIQINQNGITLNFPGSNMNAGTLRINNAGIIQLG